MFPWGLKIMPAKIIKRKVGTGIYLLRFRTQYEMSATFLRIQEHYESPRFHGRIFSLEQYTDWYVAEHGKFTYYEDWAGFNVPSTALQPFYDGAFDPLSEKEKRLLRLFRNLRQKFYVIGVYGSGASSLTHEIAHALYFTDAAYREAVRREIRAYDTSALAKQIVKAGYAEHVVRDEMQAYLVQPSGEIGSSRRLAPLRRKVRALFRQHSGGLSIPKTR
jgi:hypothetical protein